MYVHVSLSKLPRALAHVVLNLTKWTALATYLVLTSTRSYVLTRDYSGKLDPFRPLSLPPPSLSLSDNDFFYNYDQCQLMLSFPSYN